MSEQDRNKSHQGVRNLVKINDLPLYPQRQSKSVKQLNDEPTNELEENIRDIRRTVADNLSFLDDAFQVSRGYYHHGVSKSKQLYENLIDEKEQTTKIAAIAAGALIGLTMSRKKGLFKKMIYTSAFSSSVASFCYPAKAKEYSEIVFYITKNKVSPLVKDYTGLDLNAQIKSLNDSLPDFSSIKTLWTWGEKINTTDKTTTGKTK